MKQGFFIGLVLFFYISCNKIAQEDENTLVIHLQVDNQKPVIHLIATIIDKNQNIEIIFLNKDTVRAKTSCFYDSIGRLIHYYYANGGITSEYQCFYNNFNHLDKVISVEKHSDKDTETFTTTYFYNSENQLIEERNEDTNKNNIFSHSPEIKKYTYDDSGRVVKIIYCNLDESYTDEYNLIDYSENQKIKYYYSSDCMENDRILNVLQEKTVYQYDKKDRVIKITENTLDAFATDLHLYRTITYLYDRFDRIKEITYKYEQNTEWCGIEHDAWQKKYIFNYGKKWNKIDKTIINKILDIEI